MTHDALNLARYDLELTLAFDTTPARIAAVWSAYFTHNLDVDQIVDLSAFPVWRVRQVILGPKPHPKEDS